MSLPGRSQSPFAGKGATRFFAFILNSCLGLLAQTPQNRTGQMMEQIYIGVDVAKSWLDIYHPSEERGV